MSTTSPTSFISIPASSTLPNSTSPSFSSSSSSSFSSPPAGVSGQTSKHSNVAAIAGGTVGAIAVLLLLTLVILFCTRRRSAIRVNGRGKDVLGAYDAPRGMNDLTPYRISIPASPHSGKYTMGWTDVVQNGGGGGQLKAPRMIGEGVADISESASPVGGEEWRTELDNIRREVQEMRTSTRFELPPVYHADAER
ncbi:hypothetical protein D9757_009534 [Collybiopsis confluens]|uniref:Uncharacterized protein n=1 Tax=Collybiopsis confluens TaxID=2823264 RepID=A0A8H5H800_9AGAR|nr:hypothetical protein D9757_009534 [Collybiopsis confluens]